MAAGLGYKEFLTGDVLTAADANGYLASQVVMVFASSAARAAAITSPQEGMFTYLKDTDITQYYSGSAYVTIGATTAQKVIQVVNATYSTSTSTSSGTMADTGLTASITPTLNTSKVLVMVSQNGLQKSGNLAGAIRLVRGSTSLFVIDSFVGYTNTAAVNSVGGVSVAYLDSPATTSATTYKTQFLSDNGASFTVQAAAGAGASNSTITLMEIGA